MPAVARVVASATSQGFAGEVLVGDATDVLFVEAVGLADREHHASHRAGALWRWASVTKQVTAALVMQQVDARRLGLDDPIGRHLPAFADGPSATVTVRQLLMHTSGLPNPDDSPVDASGQPSFYTRAGNDLDADALAYCSGAPKRAPGARFEYNNCDTLVLGAMLSHLEGAPFARIVQTRVAAPLALASLRLADGAPRAAQPSYDAAGARVPQPRLATFGASGALEGTALDLMAFDRGLLSRRLVSEPSTTAMWTGEPRFGYVALGAWAFPAKLAGCSNPVQLVERRGDVGGTQVRNVIAPELGRIVIVFTNVAEFEFGEVWQGKGFTHDLLVAALCGQGS